MALPMVISMLVNSLYNIVDSFFVAQISEDAMTAISLVFPMQNFINSVMIGFGIGINSVISFYTGCVQAKRGIIKPENTFECFNIPFLDLFEYEQIHNNLVSTDN